MKKLLLILLVWATPALRAADPVDALGWATKGNLLYHQKNYDAALAAYANSIRLDGRSAAAYQGVGNCYMGKGDQAKAIKYYKYSLQLAPDNQALSSFVAKLEGKAVEADDYAKGNQLYRERRYDEAIEAYKRASYAGTKSPRPWQAMGNCYYAKGDKGKAIEAYRKAIELDPSNTALVNFVASYSGTQTADASGYQGGGGFFQPAWRSILVPGWGQFYNGEGTKGMILGALTYGLFAGEIASYMAGISAKDQYMSQSGPNADYDGSYSAWESMSNMNHLFFVGMTAAYSYTLIDAIWNARKPGPLGSLPGKSPVTVLAGADGAMIKAKVLEF